MKAFFMWLGASTFLGMMLYLGFVQGIHGAQNVAITYVWMVFIFSFWAYDGPFQRKIAKEKPSFVPTWVATIVAFAFIVTLIWYGAIFTGFAYFFTWFNGQALIAEIKKIRAWEAACKPLPLHLKKGTMGH